MKEFSKTTRIPIYGLRLELVVTDNTKKSQQKEPRFTNMGKQNPCDFMGLAMYNGWKYCIIFDRRYLDHALISHETFHTTHHMMDYVGVKFKVNNHEALAQLNGHIAEFVYNQLKQWKIKIK